MTLTALALSLILTQTPAEGPLQRAEAAAELLEFDQAEQDFRRALEAPGSREERLRAYKGLGLSLAFMGKAREARQTFETLLLLDPNATVTTSLGPKITKPFEAARRAVKSREVKFTLERDRFSGELIAEILPGGLPVTLVNVFARKKGTSEEQVATGTPAAIVVALEMDPTWNVEAYAVAEDEAGGVLLEAGSEKEPLFFKALRAPEPTHEAISSAKQIADQEREPAIHAEEAPSRWPWIVGAVGVIGAGVVAGVLVSQGSSSVSLPAATRVEQLP